MSRPLRVLLVEDQPDDAQLTVDALREVGYDVAFTRVVDAAEMQAALKAGPWDIVLADHALPRFDAPSALRLLQQSGLDLPFIIVSGTISDETAALAMHAGAHNYVVKDHLARLAPAVERELAEAVRRADHRRLAEQLRLEQERFRALVEKSSDAILILSPDGVVGYVTSAIQNLLGLPPAGVLGHRLSEFAHPDDFAACEAHVTRLQETPGASAECLCRFRRLAGDWRWLACVLTNLTHVPAVQGFVGNLRDVTEHKSREEHIRALARFSDENPNPSWRIADDGTLLYLNPAALRCFPGWPQECRQPAPSELRAIATRAMAPDPSPAETEVTHQDRHFAILGRHFADAGYVNLYGRDITERKIAEKALDENRRWLDAILDHSPGLIYAKDLEGRYVLANREFQRKFVHDDRSVVGLTVFDLHPRHVAENRHAHDLEVLKSGRPISREEHSDERDGAHIYLTTKFPLRDVLCQVHGICGIATEITERQRLQAQLLQAQKMEAFGQLAGGVSHDFNNILAVMLMQFQLMQLEPGLPATTRATLNQLEGVANRASNLTRQLLIFSRRHEIHVQRLDLNATVENLFKMLRRIVGENIAFEFRKAPVPLWVDADAGMIEQVVMNLCVNARDAMPDGGRLTIELTGVTRSPPQAAPGIVPDGFGCIAIVDTGCGMDATTRQRIFEPFFTTKPVGQGTGLGLSTAYGIVRQHHGWIEVDSAPQQGSTFRVYFPLRHDQDPAAFAGPGNSPLDAPPGGSERVLLVEDDEAVRYTAAACLRSAGYQVTEAADGIAALQLWDDGQGAFDLLITDIVMPRGVDGYKLAEHLLRQNPQLRVILMTGYSTGAVPADSAAARRMHRLSKPFSTRKLRERVRQALDTPPGSASDSPPPHPPATEH